MIIDKLDQSWPASSVDLCDPRSTGARPVGSPSAPGVVVVGADEAPAWLVDWCRRTRRSYQLMGQPVPSGRPRTTIPELTVLTAGGNGCVLVVPEHAEPAPELHTVVVAVRDLPDDAPVLFTGADIAARAGADLAPAHGVPTAFGERSVGLDDAVDRGRRLLDDAVQRTLCDEPRLAVHPRLLRMHPHELVGEGLDADLLVIGGPRPYATRLGLVAGSALHHAPCPVLLVPRA